MVGKVEPGLRVLDRPSKAAVNNQLFHPLNLMINDARNFH